ncbi:hypothetical protein BKA63DRAFT_508624 [Paraphoma chrysanthemicola]|nr:hypothetical protein BKA63DRAFT_508624 [Paraphoma chrysanthemicola]
MRSASRYGAFRASRKVRAYFALFAVLEGLLLVTRLLDDQFRVAQMIPLVQRSPRRKTGGNPTLQLSCETR